jgi:hypothetical protein
VEAAAQQPWRLQHSSRGGCSTAAVEAAAQQLWLDQGLTDKKCPWLSLAIKALRPYVYVWPQERRLASNDTRDDDDDDDDD